MLRLINVKVNADKSLTINNPIQLRQGDYNVAKLVINPSLYFTDNYDVIGTISFKRADNKQTGNLLLSKEQGNVFTYSLNDPWLTDIAGGLWFTITFDRVIRMDSGVPVVKERLYAGNASLYINPDANYTVGNYIQPTDVENLQLQIDELSNNFGNVDANIDSKLNKDFTTYPTLDWETVENTDLVILNRVDSEGNVTQYNAEAKDLYTTINGIMPDDDGNIDLNASDIPYNNTNVETALNDRVKTSDKVVYYEELQDINEPFINVTRADYSIGDGNGNNIVNTYATKTELTSATSELTNKINTDIANVNSDIMDVEGDVASLEADLSTYEFNTNSRIDSIVNGRTPAGIAKEALNSWEVNNIMITRDDNGSIKADGNTLIQSKLVLSNFQVTSDMQSEKGYYELKELNFYSEDSEYKFIISYNDNTENNNIRTYVINYYNKGHNTFLSTQTQAGTLNIQTYNNNIRINLFDTSSYSRLTFNIDKIYIIYE